jgi:hypothetical protein
LAPERRVKSLAMVLFSSRLRLRFGRSVNGRPAGSFPTSMRFLQGTPPETDYSSWNETILSSVQTSKSCISETSLWPHNGVPSLDKLIFAGKAGTGFDLMTSHDLVARLRELECRAAVPRGPTARRRLGRTEAGGGFGIHCLDPGRPGETSIVQGVAGG